MIEGHAPGQPSSALYTIRSVGRNQRACLRIDLLWE
jgi:hypothetical protein